MTLKFMDTIKIPKKNPKAHQSLTPKKKDFVRFRIDNYSISRVF